MQMVTKNNARPFLDIIVIAFCWLFPRIGLLPMYLYPVFVLFVVWLYLRVYKENFSSIGFRFKDLSWRSFIIGGLLGLAYAIFTNLVIEPLFKWLGFAEANLADFNYLKHNITGLLTLLAIAIFIAIPYEEIVFRGFIFTRIKAMFTNHKHAFIVSSIITSMLFALYHYQEGWGVVTGIFIGALFVMYLYRVFGGNLWYLIFFHITYDIFMLTAIYLG